jgi:hypothetical protein
MEKAPDERLLTRRQIGEFLSANGFPISHSTLSKYCSPAINIGPPAECWWGKLPMYRPSRALEWARSRLRPSKDAAVGKSAPTAAAHNSSRTRGRQRDQRSSASAA